MWWLKMSTTLLGTSCCILVLAMAAAQADVAFSVAAGVLLLGFGFLAAGHYIPTDE